MSLGFLLRSQKGFSFFIFLVFFSPKQARRSETLRAQFSTMFLIKREKPEIMPELFANTVDISSSDSSGCTESSDTGNSIAESLFEPFRMTGDNKRRSGDVEEGSVLKKPRKFEKDCSDVVLPPGFLSSLATSVNRTAINALPLSVYAPPEKPAAAAAAESREVSKEVRGCKQFWKAGDYEISNGVDSVSTSGNY